MGIERISFLIILSLNFNYVIWAFLSWFWGREGKDENGSSSFSGSSSIPIPRFVLEKKNHCQSPAFLQRNISNRVLAFLGAGNWVLGSCIWSSRHGYLPLLENIMENLRDGPCKSCKPAHRGRIRRLFDHIIPLAKSIL